VNEPVVYHDLRVAKEDIEVEQVHRSSHKQVTPSADGPPPPHEAPPSSTRTSSLRGTRPASLVFSTK
jgi:hypothetical protein